MIIKLNNLTWVDCSVQYTTGVRQGCVVLEIIFMVALPHARIALWQRYLIAEFAPKEKAHPAG
jgi:hypothetical protein